MSLKRLHGNVVLKCAFMENGASIYFLNQKLACYSQMLWGFFYSLTTTHELKHQIYKSWGSLEQGILFITTSESLFGN